MENKETLEEVAKRLFPDGCDGTNRSAEIYRRIFIEGAKWQQEQDKKMYSEKEVLNILNEYGYAIINEDKINSIGTIEKWFEQFKKK